MKVLNDQPSMGGGELSPLLLARTDYERYSIGLREILNCVPLPEGGATRRGGAELIAFLKDEARPGQLIEFQANRTDTYMLVLNAGVIRVFRNGGAVLSAGIGSPVYELSHPWTDGELDNLFWHQTQDVIYVTGGGRPRVIRRIADNNWTLTDYLYNAGPVQPLNPDKTLTITCSGVTGAITLTASAPLFDAGHVGSVWRIDEPDFRSPQPYNASDVVPQNSFVRHRGRIYECVGRLNAAGGLDILAVGTNTTLGSVGPTHDDGDAATGQVGYAVLRYICDAAGYVRIDTVTSATVATATVTRRLAPALASRPTNRWYAAAWSNARGWPDTVGVTDQKLVFTRDNEAYVTQRSDLNSFLTVDEDDTAVQYRLFGSDGQRVQIEWAYGAGVLILGAQSGEWVLRGSQPYDNLTETNVRNVPVDSQTSARQRPCLVSGGVVFISANREGLAIARFDPETEQVAVRELTIDNRLLLAAKAMQVVHERDPHGVLWIRLADGKLAALTFRARQDVLNCHRHDLAGGFVERLAAKMSDDGARTEVWAILRKTLAGQTRRMLVRLAPYFRKPGVTAPDATGAQLLDLFSRYQGPATNTITGLAHLNGETVKVFANGRMLPDATVSAGQITLRDASTDVLVGLPTPYRLRSLPIEMQTQNGSTKGRSKQTLAVTARLHETAGGRVRAMPGNSEDLVDVDAAKPGRPVPLVTGLVRRTVETEHDLEADAIFEGDDAMPFTLLGFTAEVDYANG